MSLKWAKDIRIWWLGLGLIGGSKGVHILNSPLSVQFLSLSWNFRQKVCLTLFGFETGPYHVYQELPLSGRLCLGIAMWTFSYISLKSSSPKAWSVKPNIYFLPSILYFSRSVLFHTFFAPLPTFHGMWTLEKVLAKSRIQTITWLSKSKIILWYYGIIPKKIRISSLFYLTRKTILRFCDCNFGMDYWFSWNGYS